MPKYCALAETGINKILCKAALDNRKLWDTLLQNTHKYISSLMVDVVVVGGELKDLLTSWLYHVVKLCSNIEHCDKTLADNGDVISFAWLLGYKITKQKRWRMKCLQWSYFNLNPCFRFVHLWETSYMRGLKHRKNSIC